MPRGDRTGPTGMGPMTGRGAGFCTGRDMPGYGNPIPGFRAWGRARGWRHGYHATGLPRWARFGGRVPGATPVTKEEESEALKVQAERLGEQLKTIQNRLSELKE